MHFYLYHFRSLNVFDIQYFQKLSLTTQIIQVQYDQIIRTAAQACLD